jgi:putative tryptophan/tyrosine transport system substrate-binding protein
VKRRKLLTLLGGAATWSLAAGAQQPGRVRRIGVLMHLNANDQEGEDRFSAFRQELQQLGWIDGRNMQIDILWGSNDADRRKYAAELIAHAPDVILASTTLAMVALHRTTSTVPIVFANVTDPVGAGFVRSLAQPGGNVTGFTTFEFSASAKWLEFLKEIAPRVMRAVVIRDPTIASAVGQFAVIQSAAQTFGLEVAPVDGRNTAEIEDHHELSAATKRWIGCDGERVWPSSERRPRHDRNSAPFAGGVPIRLLRPRWRPDLLRSRQRESVSASSHLCRPYSERREAGRSSGAGAD